MWGSGFEVFKHSFERPCRIEAFLHAKPLDESLRWARSYLNCQHLPIAHITHCFDDQFRSIPVPATRAADFEKCLHWPTGYPPGARTLIELLHEVLTLPTQSERVSLALALDWYKVAESDVPPDRWKNTPVGQLVLKAKYYKSSPATMKAAAAQLVELLGHALERHPAYKSAPYLVTVPGSAGNGGSFGESIASGVAQRANKTLIRTIGPPREAKKAGGSSSLDGLFSLPQSLDGPCVVVDDVYRSGMTMQATALAARQAGATAVFALVAAKTLRN
jgi:hypothetical protein